MSCLHVSLHTRDWPTRAPFSHFNPMRLCARPQSNRIIVSLPSSPYIHCSHLRLSLKTKTTHRQFRTGAQLRPIITMKTATIIHFASVALLFVRRSFAEIRLEPPDSLLNLSQPIKGEDSPIPEYIEGIWPPEYQADDEMWKDFVCKGDNLMKAMQASDADAGKLFQPGLTSAQSVWMSSGRRFKSRSEESY